MSAIGSDARLEAMTEMTRRLTGPGQQFEVAWSMVRGEHMQVFANRAKSLRDVLHRGAARGDDECYVFSDGRRLSYADVGRQASVVAANLRSRYGIGQGDRIAICAANCPEWITTFWAAADAGSVVVAMNGWWTPTELRNGLELTKPKLLLVDEKRHARLPADPGVPVLVIEREFAALLDESEAAAPARGEPAPIAEDDPFILIFTSGTTGRPKAAVLSHRSVIGYLELQSFMGARSAALAGRTPSSPPRRLAPMPLFHVSGVTATVSTMMGAGTTVWPLGRFVADDVLQLIKRERVGVWMGATPHVMGLLASPSIESIDPASVLSIGVGGSATTPAFVRLAESRFPQLAGTFSTGYGSTESGGLISWAPGWMLSLAGDCVGPALPTVDVRITDDTGAVVEDGIEGHIEARSPIVMEGYLGNAEANAETMRPGLWVRTGDFGRLEAGILYLASRLRDLIIRGGENIYPFEIENRLEEHPDVLEVAVVGAPHEVLGQEVLAVVVTRPEAALDEDEVREWCSEVLASYKVPTHVELRTELLPRNASGKVMKHALTDGQPAAFVAE